MQTKFYLCRHGQSAWNVEKRLQGQLDSPLTEQGKQQVRVLAQKAKNWNIAQIFSSSLGRAYQSAEICCAILQQPKQILAGIEERHFGVWQGQQAHDEYYAFKQSCYSQPQQIPAQTGESSAQVSQRMLLALSGVARQLTGKNALVITHGDALSCLMSQWSDVMELSNTQGIYLYFEDEQWHWGGVID